MILRKLFSALFTCCNQGKEIRPLDIGRAVPDLPTIDQNGQSLSLHTRLQAASSPHTLLYFYPKSDTPGWTKQACKLRDEFAQLSEAGVQVIGVSADSVAKQKSFQEKHHLPFTLLADSERTLIRAFGVKTLAGFPARQSFLISNKKIIWRDLKASPATQAKLLIEALSTL